MEPFLLLQRQFLKMFIPRPEFIPGVGLRIGVAPDDPSKQLILPTPFSLINGMTIFERLEVIKHIGLQLGIGGRMQRYRSPAEEREMKVYINAIMILINIIINNFGQESLQFTLLRVIQAFEFVKNIYVKNMKKFIQNYEIAVSFLYVLIVLVMIWSTLTGIQASGTSEESISNASAIVRGNSASHFFVIAKMVNDVINLTCIIVEQFFEYIYQNFTSNFNFAEGKYHSFPTMVSNDTESKQFMYLGDVIDSITIQNRLLARNPILIYGIMCVADERSIGIRIPIVGLSSNAIANCMKEYACISKDTKIDTCFTSILNQIQEIIKHIQKNMISTGAIISDNSNNTDGTTVSDTNAITPELLTSIIQALLGSSNDALSKAIINATDGALVSITAENAQTLVTNTLNTNYGNATNTSTGTFKDNTVALQVIKILYDYLLARIGSIPATEDVSVANYTKAIKNLEQSTTEKTLYGLLSLSPSFIVVDGVLVPQASTDNTANSDTQTNVQNLFKNIKQRVKILLSGLPIHKFIISLIMQNEYGVLESLASVMGNLQQYGLHSPEDIIRFLATGYYVNDGTSGYADASTTITPTSSQSVLASLSSKDRRALLKELAENGLIIEGGYEALLAQYSA